MDGSQDPDSRSLALLRLLQLLVLMATLWSALPEHRRQLLLLALWRRVQVACWHAARVTGRSSMRTELDQGRQLYEVPTLLARAALAAERRYEKTRGA